METRPPALIEAAIARLVPPACREHVLGDLSERYSSPRQYIVDAVGTLPFVIASRIRRTTDPILLGLQLILALAFFGGVNAFGEPSWLRGTIPALCVAAALVVRDAYRAPGPPSRRGALADAVAAVACVLAVQAVLRLAAPSVMLAPRVLIAGSALAFVFVLIGRMSFPPKTSGESMIAANGPLSSADFARDVRHFEQRIRWRNRREMIAGAVVIVAFGAALWFGPSIVLRLGSALTVAGVLFIMYRIRATAAVTPIPTSGGLSESVAIYRRELARQRDLLRTVTWWYLMPLFPGLCVFTLGQALLRSQPQGALRAFCGSLVIGVLIQRLNQRAATRIQQKIDSLAAMEK